jgi:triacylglycerol lipase
LTDLDNVIEDDFAAIRDNYETPKNPIILAHGLLGFDELHVTGLPGVPGIKYWYGISEALAAKGVEVITAEVPPSGRIEVRAQRLAEVIERKANGKSVNIIA